MTYVFAHNYSAKFCFHITLLKLLLHVLVYFNTAFFLLDFVFAQGTDVVFKVALCLLSSHEGEIVECDSFESIVDYLKTTLPTLTQAQMEQTIAKVQRGMPNLLH